jgi:hypothetical protein
MQASEDFSSRPVRVTVESTLPQADLFARALPAITEGPSASWQLARTIIDFACAVLATRVPLREDHRIRDAVLTALLRRALVTIEAVVNLLAQSLEEPAIAVSRTLLDIELSIKLIHQDATDAMAKRLAAFHYYTYQRHGQDMLSDRETRLGELVSAQRVAETVEVARGYSHLLESDVFDDVRDDVKSAMYWHGYPRPEEAFNAIGQASDYFMTYDIGTWFVHAVNVDSDFLPSDKNESFQLKALAQRDPKVIQLHLQHALFRFHAVLQVYIDERGLPSDPAFSGKTIIKFPDGHLEELDHMSGMTALLLAQFPSSEHNPSSQDRPEG